MVLLHAFNQKQLFKRQYYTLKQQLRHLPLQRFTAKTRQKWATSTRKVAEIRYLKVGEH
jgi:hypothetical protein